MSVALIIVYNNRYEENIEVLERLYRGRFSHMYHLMPFYHGEKSNVIPVYETSIYFQGHLAQGLRHYFREEYVHYLFVHDDLMLNPAINEMNYQDFFQLEGHSSFLVELLNLHETKCYVWLRDNYNYDPINASNDPLREAARELPSYDEALQILKRSQAGTFKFTTKPLRYAQLHLEAHMSIPRLWYRLLYYEILQHIIEPLRRLREGIFRKRVRTLYDVPRYIIEPLRRLREGIFRKRVRTLYDVPRYIIEPLRRLREYIFRKRWRVLYDILRYIIQSMRRLRGRIERGFIIHKHKIKRVLTTLTNYRYHPVYPLVMGYSDLVIVSAKNIKKFCHYCGVFAATDLFAEFAIPTALMLSEAEIVTQKELGHSKTTVMFLLTAEQRAGYRVQYKNQLTSLLADFPEDALLMHPIKPSQWNTEI